MPQFSSLAALRGALTSSDADQRGDAYQAVLGRTDIQPSDVLGSDPDSEVVEQLAEADVIPEPGPGGGRRRPVDDRQEEMVEVLKDIRDALEGGS